MGSLGDKSYQIFCAEALLERLQKLIKEIVGVRRAEDIENIHRMRVASRRMRSALKIFDKCLPDKTAKNWSKQMRGVTQALGDARDADVQLDFLKKFLDNVTEPRYLPGIQRLLFRLVKKREILQKKVNKAMDQLESSGLLDDMAKTLRHIRVHGRLHYVDQNSPYIYQEANFAISLRLEEMLAYEPYIGRPESLKELHAMRIAAKRLRYTMEIFESLYNDEFKQTIETVRDIQTVLGDLHDRDVWINYLSEFLVEEKTKTLEYFGHTRTFSRLKVGIIYLQQELQDQRQKIYQEFVEFWKKTRDQKIWDNLLEQVTRELKQSFR